MQDTPRWFPFVAKIGDIVIPMGMGIAITLSFENGLNPGFFISWFFGTLFLFSRWVTR